MSELTHKQILDSFNISERTFNFFRKKNVPGIERLNSTELIMFIYVIKVLKLNKSCINNIVDRTKRIEEEAGRPMSVESITYKIKQGRGMQKNARKAKKINIEDIIF